MNPATQHQTMTASVADRFGQLEDTTSVLRVRMKELENDRGEASRETRELSEQVDSVFRLLLSTLPAWEYIRTVLNKPDLAEKLLDYCSDTGVTHDDLCGISTKGKLRLARHNCVFLMATHRVSPTDIGRALGGRSADTIRRSMKSEFFKKRKHLLPHKYSILC